MKEYTLLVLLSVLVVVVLDTILKTRVTKRGEFWVFVVVMAALTLLTNGYLTWRPIVLYGDPFYLHLRLGTIPLEDFMFGFSMVTLTVVLWEYAKKGTAELGDRR